MIMTEKIKTVLKNEVEKFQKRIQEIRKNETFSFDDPVSDRMYTLAVSFAYNDAKRALKGIAKTPEKQNDKETALSTLTTKLKEYFEQGLEFDHMDLCDSFKESFTIFSMTYGAAQKIVNLSFKYLYCFNNFKSKYFEKFANCQMVLDSFILSWFKKVVDVKGTVHIGYSETWSGMESYIKYTSIQRMIADYVSLRAQGLSVLEYEFVLWPKTLLYEAAVAWMSTISEEDKKDIYQQYPFSSLEELIGSIGKECSAFYLNEDIKDIL